MCGIAGIFGQPTSDISITLTSMAEPMKHRGPDASGIWSDAAAGIGLAHRRLSILDLTVQGSQPMVSDNGRFVLCYNGEIYNHQELRSELENDRTMPWRGHSDTEVLLCAIERWGVRASLERSNGMFAFAVWDRIEHKLTLARDRMGEKPLYLGWVDRSFVFASELRAFRLLPQWTHSVDRQALGLLLRFGYIPAPLSIHKGIYKLPAATFLTLGYDQACNPLGLREFVRLIESYWSLPHVVADGITNPLSIDEVEAVEMFETLIEDAVRIRMEADVPVGALLSGGIDSSLISALMQRQSTKPVRTFTIGFSEDHFDEARHARPIAEFIGSEHTELRLLPRHAMDVIPRLPDVYDEPFADPSQVPTIMVSFIARKHVTVALSGDGGDELFCGYGRYFDAYRIWGWIGCWPSNARVNFATTAHGIHRICGGNGRLGFRIRRMLQRIKAERFDDFYCNLLSLSLTPTASAGWPQGFPKYPVSGETSPLLTEPAFHMMYTDQSLYLPENILTKVDRASMAASLELRVPLLDHRIVALSWRLPLCLRLNEAKGKVLLKKVLYRHVPEHLVDRPKRGFEIPLNAWLRGPLKNWMLDLLHSSRIAAEGYMDAKAVATLVDEHLSSRADHGYAIWPVLMFQAWQQCYG